ncbi:energy transducer TonB [Sulfitobacter sp.]|uniref:energy transducer TonB n=1 Tax=Sulfitobacter sp. TaxID=1903071 RepID=UPI0032980C3E
MSPARKTGNIVSGVGHAGFIFWILFGGLFTSRPDPVEVQEAAVISGAEYQALVDAARQPQEIAPEPVPAAPEVTADAPEIDTGPQEAAAPEPVNVPEPAAEPVEQPVPDLAPEVSEAAPERPEPPAEVTVEDAPVDDTPVERQAEVIAPTPAPEPTPEAVQEPEPQEAVIPEEAGETVEQPRDATQAPEAADRIITEAAQPPAASPNESLRPPARRPTPPVPTRTAQAPETPAPAPATEPANETPVAPAPEDTAIADAATQAALDALASSAQNTVPTGPPLSSGEKDALRIAVQSCWNVDPGARWAQTTVTVAMDMTQDGKVVQSSLRMIASEGGDSSTANAAFGAARRAILLCQKDGYPLPAEKYGQWQQIEMTFNPDQMRIR